MCEFSRAPAMAGRLPSFFDSCHIDPGDGIRRWKSDGVINRNYQLKHWARQSPLVHFNNGKRGDGSCEGGINPRLPVYPQSGLKFFWRLLSRLFCDLSIQPEIIGILMEAKSGLQSFRARDFKMRRRFI